MPLEFGVYVVSTPLAASRWTHEASTFKLDSESPPRGVARSRRSYLSKHV